MIRLNLTSLTFVLLTTLSVACSDARKQYQTPTDPKVNGERQQKDPSQLVDVSGQKEACDAQCQVQKRSQLPLIYATGAAGLTFEMDLNQAQNFLSKPEYGPDADGWTVYSESIQVLWGSSEPRLPIVMIALNSYLGPLELPAPYGRVFMKDELKAHFPPVKDPNGEQFIINLFNYFESKEADFNCLQENLCNIVEEDDAIQFELPGMTIGFTKDERKALYYVVVSENVDAASLSNSFDLIQTKTTFKNAETGALVEIPFGLTWAEVKELSGAINPKAQVERKSFTKDFNGMALIISKSDYSREYIKPSDDEIYKGLALFSPFNKNILVNGDPLWISLTSTGIVKVEARPTPPAAQANTFVGALQPTLSQVALKPQVQAQLMVQLNDLLVAEMKLRYPNGVVFGSVSGDLEEKPGRDITLEVSGYDPVKKQGHFVYVSIQEKSGRLFFYTSLIDDAFAAKSMPLILQDFDANQRTLGGFALGSRVEISAMDLGRKEASLLVPALGEDIERVQFTEEANVKVVQNVGGQIRDMPTVLSTVSGFGSTALGLKALGSSDQNGEFEIKVVSFPVMGRILNLCGLPELHVQHGQTDVAIQRNLIAAVEKANAMVKSIQAKKQAREKDILEGNPLDPAHDLSDEEQKYAGYSKCNYSATLKSDSTGLISNISFPDQGLSINFSNRTLSSVTIYPKSWDAQNVMANEGVQQ